MTRVACRRDAPTVTAAEIAKYHSQVSDWEIVELDGIKRLTRVFPFDDIAQALSFCIQPRRLRRPRTEGLDEVVAEETPSAADGSSASADAAERLASRDATSPLRA
jgi:hypothetical protein